MQPEATPEGRQDRASSRRPGRHRAYPYRRSRRRVLPHPRWNGERRRGGGTAITPAARSVLRRDEPAGWRPPLGHRRHGYPGPPPRGQPRGLLSPPPGSARTDPGLVGHPLAACAASRSACSSIVRGKSGPSGPFVTSGGRSLGLRDEAEAARDVLHLPSQPLDLPAQAISLGVVAARPRRLPLLGEPAGLGRGVGAAPVDREAEDGETTGQELEPARRPPAVEDGERSGR